MKKCIYFNDRLFVVNLFNGSFHILNNCLNKPFCKFNTNTPEYDKSNAYKGIRLYALPASAKLEHFVLDKEFYVKGLTMCQIRFFLKITKMCKKKNFLIHSVIMMILQS